MKHYLFIILCAVLFAACVNNSASQQDSAVATTEEEESSSTVSKYAMANIVDSIIVANPDFLNNDIKQKKVAKEIQSVVLSSIKGDHSILTQIPLTYKMMMQKGNKYIIKFELANIGNSGTRISDKYNIYFNVFTEMGEEEASDLIDNHKYHLTFETISDVNNNLVLPSGRVFTDEPNVYKTSVDELVNVCPGAFLLKGVKYTE